MKNTDLAYMAGLFDGEGTISIVCPKGRQHRLQISLASTDEWVCQSLKMMFGGGIYIAHEETDHNRRCWFWFAYAIVAEKMLSAIFPYMRIKRSQAEVALRFRRSIDSKAKSKITDSQKALREAEAVLIRSMNKGKRIK